MPILLLQLEGVALPAVFLRGAVLPLVQARRAAWQVDHPHDVDDVPLWTSVFASDALVTTPQRDLQRNLRRWRTAGIPTGVFGPIRPELQRIMLATTVHGDLRPWFEPMLGPSDGDPAAVETWRAWSSTWPDLQAVVTDPAIASAARSANVKTWVICRTSTPGEGEILSLDAVT